MTSIMNPVDQYRDSTLDDPTPPSGAIRNNGPVHRRSSDENKPTSQTAENGRRSLLSQEALQRPLISYRGVGANTDAKLHRSFSQRAKGRPFADEAFADENLEQYTPTKPQRTNGRSRSDNYAAQSPLQSYSTTTNGHSIQDSVQAQRPSSSSDAAIQSKARSTIVGGPQVANDLLSTPKSSVLRDDTNTTRDAVNQTEDQRRNWASDRSPLQKLEVKLTDISKEEKRARVQEAEMRLRESQGSQRSQKRPDQTARSVSNPVRTTSQRGIQPVGSGNNVLNPDSASSSVAPKEATRLSKERPGARQAFAPNIPARQHGPATQAGVISQPKQHLEATKARNPQPPRAREQVRASSTRQITVSNLNPSNSNDQPVRSVSFQQRRPQETIRAIDRPITERERNASHQAALQQLTGQETVREPPQNSARASQRSQTTSRNIAGERNSPISHNSPIAVDLSTLSGDDQGFGYMVPQNAQAQGPKSSQTQRSQPPIGLGVSTPPIPRTFENPDSGRNKQGKSSVSFKEPFDKRRPIDEWRAAGTARLVADDFLTEQVKQPDTYKAWWEQDQGNKGKKAQPSSTYTLPAEQIDDRTASFNPPLYLKCGPLLRYAGLKRTKADASSGADVKEYWRGTIMIVTQDSQCSYDGMPTLRLFSQPKKLLPPPPALVTGDQLAPEYIDPIAGLTKLSRNGRALYVRPVDHLEEAKDLSRIEDDNGIYEASPSPLDVNGNKNATAATTNKRTLDMDGERLGRYKEVKGVRIYADPDRDVTFWRFNIEIELGPEQQHVAYRINKSASVGFWVPARGKTMNIMFHSCNGFSMSVDVDSFSGPDPLWRDVLNNHQTRPFHVMIGGGDQVYNDRVMADTQLFGDWTKLKNPHTKHQAPFTPEMRDELESFYLERYAMWFSQGLFGMANASIPMVNIWDDHDIIDGFGSYPDEFMKSPVFTGVGEIAHKYYLLFQHQTIDAMTEKDEPSWVLGHKPGPYIQHVSRSVYMELGQHVGFLGLDGRTERTRHDVISIDTLEILLERCRREMIEGQTKHLIVLLGVPIAYPRLVWLENVLTSRALDPIKALHRAGIVKTKLLNRFDGGVEILDDLDDHWTATHHKDERNILIQDLQDLAAEKSARITILSGDVHLAAVGQFYSNPKLKVPKDKDHRYMPNIVSSAIVNTPPPDMMADVLNKRNKVHHLDKYTDEDMIPMFTHDVDDKKRNNTRLLPRRNWCSIREYVPGDTPPPSPPSSPSLGEDESPAHSDIDEQYHDQHTQPPKRRLSLTKDDFNPRNLMRRISSRGAPPSAYKSGAEADLPQQRAASFDGVDRPQRSFLQSSQPRASSADHIPDVRTLRPTFHRRPTNLSEKAARKGIVPDIDAEGNEVHFNDRVNLEGGLDIVLNCEVNQRDPAGITTQYRLLVPALWYDGSSDRQKLSAPPPPSRRDTLLKKFGMNPRRANQSADNQGAGNWGQEMSETESYTGSEEEGEGGAAEPPKKSFSSFLGSLRKKQTRQPEIGDIQHPHFDANRGEQNGQQVPTQNDPRPSYPDSSPITGHQNLGQPVSNTVPRELKHVPQQSGLSYHDPSQLRQPYQERQQHPQSQPPYGEVQHPRHSHQSHQEMLQPRQSQASHHMAQQPASGSSSQRNSQRVSRSLSYTIGGGNTAPPLRSEYSSTQAEGRPPYDPDAAYVSRQQENGTNGTQRNSQGHTIGGGSSNGSYDPAPHPPLRGNGIIGRNIPPSSFRDNNDDARDNGQQEQVRGYSGIEAYKDPKPSRRWSLKERARNIMGSRKRDSGNEWYSDEEEEAYWEGSGGRKWA